VTTEEALARIAAAPATPAPFWRWATAKTAGGYEHRTPDARTVCAGAGLTPDVGILACAAASEFRQDHPAELLAGCHAILNDCHDRDPQLSVESRVTMLGLKRKLVLPYPAAGYFGRQSGRWCSSWQPPTLRTVEAAKLALGGAGIDLACGARRWVDGHVQDSGWQAGKRLDNDAEGIVRSRYEEGWRWVGPVAGVVSYRLILLARRGRPLAEAVAMIAAARRGLQVVA